MNSQLMRIAGLYELYPDEGRELLEDTDACPVEFRDFAWGFYYGQCKRRRLTLNRKSWSVAVSHDGKMLVTGSDNGEVIVWDVKTGTSLTTLGGHTSFVQCVFSPDGKTLASGDHDGTIILWEVATWKVRLICGEHTEGVHGLAFSPDGHSLAASGKKKLVNLWDTATGELRATLEGISNPQGKTETVHSLVFSPNGKTIAFCRGLERNNLFDPDDEHGLEKLEFWEPESGSLRTILKEETTWGALAFTSDGKTLIAAGTRDRPAFPKPAFKKGEIWRFGLESGKEAFTSIDTSKARFAPQAFATDCKTVVSFDSAFLSTPVVTLWDVETGHARTTLRLGKNFFGQVQSIAFSFDSKTLAAAGSDGELKLWNVEAAREHAVLHGHTGWVFVALSSNGTLLASTGEDKTIRLWDPINAMELVVLGGDGRCVALSADGMTLAQGGDGTVLIWDLDTKKVQATLKGHSWLVDSVAFSPDGRTLASGDATGTIKLWSTANGEERTTLKVHSGGIGSLLFTRDGNTLISTSQDNTINLWDLTSEKVVATLDGHGENFTCLAISPNGKTLASGGNDGKIRLWDLSVRTLRATLNVVHPVFSLAYTPDGNTLAVAVNDILNNPGAGAIKLLDVATSQERATIERCGALSLVFTPDGNSLISGGVDGAIRIWDGRIDR
jgi:WD40 repeat protein